MTLGTSTSLDNFDTAVDELLADRLLLTHPFYLRWSQGRLAPEELTAYAEQYRHFEAALPAVLTGLLADPALPGRARSLVAANLADETGTAGGSVAPHLQLFDRFAAAVGARADAPAAAATAALVATYRTAPSALEGLGVLVAYESQAAAVAASKAAGLGQYGVGDHDAAFWTEHATVDTEHRAWAIEALADLAGGSISAAAPGLRRGADAWWAFLDEREAAAAR